MEVINSIPLPTNKKETNIFLGKINFLRRFIPNYEIIIKEITVMLKKDEKVMWTRAAIEYFSQIRKDFGEALVFVCPNYEIPF